LLFGGRFDTCSKNKQGNVAPESFDVGLPWGKFERFDLLHVPVDLV